MLLQVYDKPVPITYTDPMTPLAKSTTRERTLFYMHIWSQSDLLAFEEWAHIPLSGSLCVGEGAYERLTAWDDQNMVDAFTTHVAQQSKKDPEYIPKLLAAYQNRTATLGAFITQKRGLGSVSELREFYTAFVSWWSPMSALLEFPDLNDAPSELVNEVLVARRETERWPDIGEEFFHASMQHLFPNLSDAYSLMTPEEIFILENRPLSEEEKNGIAARKKGYFILDGILGTIDTLEAELQKKDYRRASSEAKSVTEVRGTPAFAGSVKGLVRIIRYRNELHTIAEGEILVTEMTTPDFIPAMRKASAIVTDEGGITCHADIVARELKKPCVVGTKIATEVFVDGDLVEVDANSGVVRRL